MLVNKVYYTIVLPKFSMFLNGTTSQSLQTESTFFLIYTDGEEYMDYETHQCKIV